MSKKTTRALTASLQQFGLARDRMRSAIARQAGITETDLDALEYLEAQGPLTQRALGELLGITSGAVTMLVDRLADGAWVERRPHPSDRRAVLVALSATAVERTPQGLVDYHRTIESLASAIAESDQQNVTAFLGSASEAATQATSTLRSRKPKQRSW